MLLVIFGVVVFIAILAAAIDLTGGKSNKREEKICCGLKRSRMGQNMQNLHRKK
jgi:hypothetical protein